ncbi:MAG: PEP-CTERM sorting domain-containing protein [Stellaceae bacterium]
MKVRHLLAGTALATTLAFAAAPAMATPIDISSFTGIVTIGFGNFESFTGKSGLAVGSDNYGIITVNSISDPLNNNLWVPGKDGQFLAGVFSGVTVQSITATTSGFKTRASGGHLDIYMLSANPNAALGTSGYTGIGCAVDTQCYNGITNVGGELVLSMDFTPGQAPLSPTTTITSQGTSTGVNADGTAHGYLDIVGGTNASRFTPDFFDAFGFLNMDMKFQDTFCVNGATQCGAQVGDWGFLSHDPVKADITAVPEPTSLALLGAAMLGMVPFLRRRKNKKSA